MLGQKLELCGWVRSLRDQNHFGFIELNDGSFFKNLQVVIKNDLPNFDEVVKYGVGAAIIVQGTLQESEGKGQDFEVVAQSVTLAGEAPSDYPLQKKRHGFEFLRTIAHLRPRTNTYNAVFRARSVASFAIHKFFVDRGYVYLHSPVITTMDGEGAGEVFRLDEEFFGKPANLTVTGQLHAEAFALAFGKTYTFGPTFRAENSNTTKHLAEFIMMEPEIAFADLNACIAVIEEMIKEVTAHVMQALPEEMEFFDKFIEKGLIDRLNNVVNSDFGRITYTDAIAELEKSGKKFEYPVKWGLDLKTEHERFISEELFKKPVFVVDYPKDIKAFYMRRNDDGKTVAGTDLLVPQIGEIVGGSQREERLDILLAAMAEHGLKEEDYQWYLELRRFGGVEHAGFGLGFERFLMYITGMANIRDVSPFPRAVNSIDF